MATLATLNVLLNLRAQDFRSGLQSAQQALRDFNAQAQQRNAGLTANVRQAQTNLQSITASTKSATAAQAAAVESARANLQKLGAAGKAALAPMRANLATFRQEYQIATDRVNQLSNSIALTSVDRARAYAAGDKATAKALRDRILDLREQRALEQDNVLTARKRVQTAQRDIETTKAQHQAGVDNARQGLETAKQALAATRGQGQAARQAARDQVQAAQQALTAAKTQQQAQRQLLQDEVHRQRALLRGQQAFNQTVSGVGRALGQSASEAASKLDIQRRALVQGATAFGAFAITQRLAQGTAQPLLNTFGQLAQTVSTLIRPTAALGRSLSGVISTAGSLAGDVLGLASKAVGGSIAMVGAGIGTILSSMGGVLTATAAIASGVATIGAAFLTGPGALIVLAIGGIVVAIAAVFDGILGGAGKAIGAVAGMIGGGELAAVGEAIGKVIGLFATMAGDVVGGLVDRMVGLGVAAVKVAADFEMIEISFGHLVGSAEKAKEILNDLKQFAAVTPFRYRDLAKEVQQLTAVGFAAEQAIGTIKQLGNVAAAMPGDFHKNLEQITHAMATMKAKGTVQAREMTRLAHAGIPAWEALANRISMTAGRVVTVAEAMQMVEARSVSAVTGIMSILDVANSPKFAGLTQEQSQSLLGLWSTVTDNLELLGEKLGLILIKAFDIKGAQVGLIGLFEFLKSKVDDVAPAMMLLGTTIRTVFEIIAQTVKMAAESFTDWSKGLDASPEKLLELKLAVIETFKNGAIGAVEFGAAAVNAVIDIINKIPELKKWFVDVEMAGWGIAESLVQAARVAAGLGGVVGLAIDHFAGGAALDFIQENKRLLEQKRLGIGLDQRRMPHVNPAGALAGIDQWAGKMTDVTLKSQNAVKAASAVGLALMPLGALAGAQAAGFIQLAGAIGQVNFGLDPLPKHIADLVKEMSSPLEKFKRKMQELAADIKKSMPGAFKVAGQESAMAIMSMGGLVGLAARVGLTVAQHTQSKDAIAALRRKAAQDKLEEMKKFGPSHADVGAMQKGSQEAASVINRALNAANLPKEDDVAGHEEMMVELNREQNRILDRIALQMDAVGKKVGVGPGI